MTDTSSYAQLKSAISTLVDGYSTTGGYRTRRLASSLRLLLTHCDLADAESQWWEDHWGCADPREPWGGLDETEKES